MLNVTNFIEAVEIAEVAFAEGKPLKAAYWIGQATVYADQASPEEWAVIRKDYSKVYSKWRGFRSMCQTY